MNCKNCKYFRPNTETNIDAYEVEACVGYGSCLNPKIIDDCKSSYLPEIPAPDTQCLVANCDENRAFIYVGENFGCIHFDQI